MRTPAALMLSLLLGVTAATPVAADDTAIGAVLDALHERAAAADFDGYFALFDEQAVFLGTDRDEYWPIARFREYTRARFATGTGWTYTPTERIIHVADSTAWFEERVHNEKYGELRGTGVLVHTAAGWRIAQYNLTLPLPNPLFARIATEVIEHYTPTATHE